jgi:hypothetical protein
MSVTSRGLAGAGVAQLRRLYVSSRANSEAERRPVRQQAPHSFRDLHGCLLTVPKVRTHAAWKASNKSDANLRDNQPANTYASDQAQAKSGKTDQLAKPCATKKGGSPDDRLGNH